MPIPAVPAPGVRQASNWWEGYLLATTGRLTSWPIYAYGHSYTLLNQAWHTSGQNYLQLLASELNGGTVTSYGIGGSRTYSAASGMLSNSSRGSLPTPISGSLWPGTSGRSGLVVIDTIFNDIMHQSAAGSGPIAITTANTRYKDSIESAMRATLALASSESRVEQTAATFTGTWAATALANAGFSGGSVAYTTTAAAKAAFSVTPAQTGLLAGKVWLLSYKIDTSVGVMAQMTIDVDGAGSFTHTPTAFEQFTDENTAAVESTGLECIEITVPIDNAAHTVNVTHSGSAGQYMYVDCILVPSTDPNPVLVLDTIPPGPVIMNASQVGIWRSNYALLAPVYQDVVGEFPNVAWVPSTMTSNGLWSFDETHPNDRGMRQRAGDCAVAVREFLPRLRSRALQQAANSEFGVI